jgi:hypothetical protein
MTYEPGPLPEPCMVEMSPYEVDKTLSWWTANQMRDDALDALTYNYIKKS